MSLVVKFAEVTMTVFPSITTNLWCINPLPLLPSAVSSMTQYGSVKGYAVLKTINTGVFIMMPVPLCLTCLDRNFDPGFFTTLGLFLAHSFRYVLIENLQSQPTQKKGSSCGCNP